MSVDLTYQCPKLSVRFSSWVTASITLNTVYLHCHVIYGRSARGKLTESVPAIAKMGGWRKLVVLELSRCTINK